MRTVAWTAGLALASIAGASIAGSAASAEEIRLAMTSMSPAASNNSIYFNAWATRVNEQSSGTLKVEVKDGQALAHFGNVYDRVTNDVVQIGWSIHQIVAGKFPLTDVGGLPFIAESGEVGSPALWRVYKAGLLDSEYVEIVPLWLSTFPPGNLHFSKAPKSVDDVRGLKFAAAGRMQSLLTERIGGTPISIPSQDMYEALQRGTVDAAIISWAGFAPYKLHEVSSYHVEGPLGQNTSMFFMTRARFNALPAAAKKALEDNGGEAQSRAFGKYLDGEAAKQRAPVKASDKHTVVEL